MNFSFGIFIVILFVNNITSKEEIFWVYEDVNYTDDFNIFNAASYANECIKSNPEEEKLIDIAYYKANIQETECFKIVIGKINKNKEEDVKLYHVVLCRGLGKYKEIDIKEYVHMEKVSVHKDVFYRINILTKQYLKVRLHELKVVVKIMKVENYYVVYLLGENGKRTKLFFVENDGILLSSVWDKE